MFSFVFCIIFLVAGYVVWGGVVERVLDTDPARPTPALEVNDGVDYVPLPWWRVFLIQLLNIAGLGPIFGAVVGARWGTAAFLWIVVGAVFVGAVHDYVSAHMSVRRSGAQISELIGEFLGTRLRMFFTVFVLVMMTLVVTVFTKGPADLLARLCGRGEVTGLSVGSSSFWMLVILAYYFVATMFAVDKVIGRIYPIFSLALLGMVGGLSWHLLFGEHPPLPPLTLANHHPQDVPLWPFICISIACGAVSGFHATQSPIMARCITSERLERRVFYGAMIAESFIALVWAAAALTFFSAGRGGLDGACVALASAGSPAVVIEKICRGWLGGIGFIMALLGVVVLPITSGDTALRGARLLAADFLGFDQKPLLNRLALTLPFLLVSASFLFVDFSVVWRYFAWANQTLAAFTLWACSVYLARKGSNHAITSIPAFFMTAVVTTYILAAREGLALSWGLSCVLGASAAVLALVLFLFREVRPSRKREEEVSRT